jgi:hypothetical protein
MGHWRGDDSLMRGAGNGGNGNALIDHEGQCREVSPTCKRTLGKRRSFV